MSISVVYLAGASPTSNNEAAGTDSAGGLMPWLAEAPGGRLLIELVWKRLRYLQPARFVVLANDAELRRSRLAAILAQLTDRALMRAVPATTAGAACTALLAVDLVDADSELLLLSANEFLDADYAEIIRRFRASGADAGLACFDSIHPRYAFARVDEAGLVVEVAQRDPISRHAIAGFYWARRAADLFGALAESLRKDAVVEGAFYVAPALNELILKQKRIVTLRVEASIYHPLKTQRQIETFEGQKSTVR